ncbi:hypothetical protein JOD54_002186 [Actinokineospora baliensis]|uniref:phage tail protein n=1 Tax=Actinokineospora baliensis TaxID=547056 RepID=UPI0019567C3F|nr:hypothetical protein [Actinokineospora baliensis]MBM7771982.1 hypothetical protein [Actinokineospora baliensis]
MAKGPGGKEVDRVAVRVAPNTSKFAKQLRAFLKNLKKMLRLTVPVELDIKHARQSMARLRRDLAKPVKVAVQVDAKKLDTSLPRIDMSGLNLDLGPTETLIGNILVKWMQTERFLGLVRRRAVEVARETLNIAKRTANVRAHWRYVGGKLTQAAKSIRAIKADGFYKNLLRTGDALAGATGRMGRFGIAATRTLGRTTTRLARGAASAVGTIGSALGSAVGSLGKLGRAGWIAVGVFTLAAPAIGLVSTLLAGLPSLGLAAAAGIAAVSLGLDGIKRAAAQLKPNIAALKASLSANFESGLKPVFAQLKRVFPVLDRGLNKVADGVIVMAQSFVDVVTSAQGLRQIEAILGNTGKFFTQLSPMVRDGTSAFLALGKAGSEQFGLLASVLNKFAQDFRAATDRVISDGSFKQGISGLAKVTSSLLDVFVKLFESGIRVMGQIGGSLSELISAVGDAAVVLLPILGTLTNLVSKVLTQGLRALIPVVEALQPAFELLAEMVGTLLGDGAIGGLAPILLELARVVNSVLVMALRAIQPAIGPLVDFLVQLGRIVGDFLAGAFRELEPLLTELSKILSELLIAAVPLLPSLLEIARVGFGVLLAVLSQLVPPAVELARVALPILVDIVRLAVPAVAQLAKILGGLPLAELTGAIVQFLIPAFNAVLVATRAVWPLVSGIIKGGLDFAIGLIRLFVGLLTGNWQLAWEGAKQILSGAWVALKNGFTLGLRALYELVVGIPMGILRSLGNLGSLLYDAGASIISGLIDGIRSMFNSALNWVGGLVSDIRDLFPFSPAKKGPFSGKGYTLYSGRALVSDWAKGIRDGTPAAIGAIEEMMAATNTAASAEWQGEIKADGFGGIGSVVADALSGWQVQLDGGGLAKLVNKANTRNARRG